jgi:hypothetical protein
MDAADSKIEEHLGYDGSEFVEEPAPVKAEKKAQAQSHQKCKRTDLQHQTEEPSTLYDVCP